ncbi:zinc finger MYND domain-containing protein 11-like isoform X1 [Dinothrombium tinctorium]|uniref:Zinc finger MYND domain-containing protein 11-like isoform X1 n=1 Tax=Dinothrombium tinctorium TaxID=1965070 RepID=A0A3S3Q951_9ACAR|nr:zinc finger MYND domain-containing protein 11-like isoform X1 [Dinothrombium tinctorium]RWS05749.1 zinc finger MYND domain-containing protein 11-like isoform X1 [Dinothrombium tinctorium]
MGRTAKPWFVLNAWKAIHALESNQVATNLSTIVNCDSLLSHSIAEIKQELISAIKDELIDEFDDGLLKINHTIVSSSHDWYCFVCFNPGERMIGCQSCFRLYHKTCFRYSEEEGKCYYCQVHPQEKIRGKLLDISTINDTLEILFHNLVANFQSLMDIASLKDESPVILKLLSKLLHNPHFDFLSLQNKINEQQYKSIADFIVDFKLIYFNVAILNGPGSIVVEKFDEMFKYILSQEKIITSCIQCYYNLYCKVDGEENFDWFLVPCNPPHRLCFAKIEEFCHPVKVIKSNINESFVWLFDENHEFITVNNESLIDSLPKEEIITPELSKALEAYEHLLSMGNESKERDFDNDNGEDFSEKCNQ